MRLFVIAHTSGAGHCGQIANISELTSQFYWDKVKADAKLFLSNCIHFLSFTGGEKIPRPFEPAVFGTKPNDLLQFD